MQNKLFCSMCEVTTFLSLVYLWPKVLYTLERLIQFIWHYGLLVYTVYNVHVWYAVLLYTHVVIRFLE